MSRDRHWHGGFPGGYENPDDPDGPPIPFTTEPAPGVRDYNGALLSVDSDTALRTADVLWGALQTYLTPDAREGFGRLYEPMYRWMLEQAAPSSLEESQGALSSEGEGLLDFEEMRRERGWPTPIAMRRAADGLDMIAIAHYGDVLRWFADLCDADRYHLQENGVTPSPQEER